MQLSRERVNEKMHDALSSASVSSGGALVPVWDRRSIGALSEHDVKVLRNMVNEFGERSARAQGLRASVTNLDRLLGENHKLFLHVTPTSHASILAGGLKTGYKELYLATGRGEYIPTICLCVLDFYVHASCQRAGIGKTLFDAMLKYHQAAAVSIAYDRPSSKLISFLRKHYSLAEQRPQLNHFVIFEGFLFDNTSSSTRCKGIPMGSKECHIAAAAQQKTDDVSRSSTAGINTQLIRSQLSTCDAHLQLSDTSSECQTCINTCTCHNRSLSRYDVVCSPALRDHIAKPPQPVTGEWRWPVASSKQLKCSECDRRGTNTLKCGRIPGCNKNERLSTKCPPKP
eukprot:jgi/Ulvmu1/8224/UM041_0033.1